MAHFALVDENNIVQDVLVIPDEQEHRGQEFLANDLGLGGRWLQTSYNTSQGKHLTGKTPLRGNFAGIGYEYSEKLDAFISPKPFDSWILDTEKYGYFAPVEYPTDGKNYRWDEETTSWIPAE